MWTCRFFLCAVLFSVCLCCGGRVLDSQESKTHRIRHKDSHSYLVEQVKRDILARLQMDEPPNISDAQLPPFAQDMIEQEATQEDAELDEESHFMAESTSLLLHGTQGYAEGLGETIDFHISSEDRDMKLNKLKLYFYVNPNNISTTSLTKPNHLILQLYLITTDYLGNQTAELLDHRFIVRRHLIGWHGREIQSTVIWEALQERNETDNITIHFMIKCHNCDYSAFSSIESKNNPFLTMHGRKRQLRNSNQACDGRCCKNDLIVDFEALGWTWVLHPKQFEANYCAGSCRDTNAPHERAKVSSNTHILNAMLGRLRTGSVASCCIPDHVTPVQIVYADSMGNVRSNSDTIQTIHSCRCF